MTIVARALALRADTIVLGTRARRGLDRLLGSVSGRERVWLKKLRKQKP